MEEVINRDAPAIVSWDEFGRLAAADLKVAKLHRAMYVAEPVAAILEGEKSPGVQGNPDPHFAPESEAYRAACGKDAGNGVVRLA
jgi:hypothetical protein